MRVEIPLWRRQRPALHPDAANFFPGTEATVGRLELRY